MATLSGSSSLVIHFEKASSTMGVANREIGGLALEKCRNPSEKTITGRIRDLESAEQSLGPLCRAQARL
jgi:hypothetical protein